MSAVRSGKIPIVMMLRPFRTRRIELACVKSLSLVCIAEQIVGTGDFLELFFRSLVSGIEIRVQFLRKLSICLLDIGCGSRRGNAENFVRISHELLRNNVSPPRIKRAQNRQICNTIQRTNVLDTGCRYAASTSAAPTSFPAAASFWRYLVYPGLPRPD